MFLNRFHKSNWLVIFVVAAVIGGGFEALTSLFMQYAYGAVAWDYSNMPGSLFGGRTCLPFMACWGCSAWCGSSCSCPSCCGS